MRPLTASELAALARRARRGYGPLPESLRDTAAFLWLLVALLVGILALDYGLSVGPRLKGHCNDFAGPRLHIKCAQHGEAEEAQGAVRSRHGAQDARRAGGRA